MSELSALKPVSLLHTLARASKHVAKSKALRERCHRSSTHYSSVIQDAKLIFGSYPSEESSGLAKTKLQNSSNKAALPLEDGSRGSSVEAFVPF